MRISHYFFLLCTLSSAWAGTEIQPQVKGMLIFTPGALENSNTSVIGTDPDLSYQLLNNEHGVGTELTILQAEAAGHLHPVTAGGLIEVDAVAGQTISGQTNN